MKQLTRVLVSLFIFSATISGAAIAADGSKLVINEVAQFPHLPITIDPNFGFDSSTVSVALNNDRALVSKFPDLARIYTRNVDGSWGFEADLVLPVGGLPDYAAQRSVALIGDTALITNSTAGFIYKRTNTGVWNLEAEFPDLITVNSIALGDDIVVVGQGRDYVGNRRVVVHRRNQIGQWLEEARLASDVSTINFDFATAIAVSGNTIVIGAEREVDYTDNSDRSTKVRFLVFNRSDGVWSQQSPLDTSHNMQVNGFYDPEGGAIAIDDNLIVTAYNSGSISVFSNNDSVQPGIETRLLAIDEISRIRLGYSLATDGDFLLAGAPDDVQSSASSGSAILFQFNESDGSWHQEAKLTPGDLPDGTFGGSVALENGIAIVGSTRSVYEFDVKLAADKDSDGVRNSLDNCTGESNADQSDVDGDGLGDLCDPRPNTAILPADQIPQLCNANNPLVAETARQSSTIQQLFDSSSLSNDISVFNNEVTGALAMSGDLAVVGANLESKVVVYRLDAAGEWQFEAALKPADAEHYDLFGTVASISGNTILVGAPNNQQEGVRAGAAYVFRRQADNVWVQEAKIVADNQSDHSFFGSSVALDGDAAVISSSLPAVKRIAYLFRRNTDGSWLQEAQLNPPNTSFEHNGQPDDLNSASHVAIHGNYALLSSNVGGIVFVRDEFGEWQHQTYLADPGAVPGRFFNSESRIDLGCGYALVDKTLFRLTEGSGIWSAGSEIFPGEHELLAANDRYAVMRETVVRETGRSSIGIYSNESADSRVKVAHLESRDPLMFTGFATAALNQNTATIAAGYYGTVYSIDLNSIQGSSVNFPYDSAPPPVCRGSDTTSGYGWQDNASCIAQENLIRDPLRSELLAREPVLLPQSDAIVAFSGNSAIVANAFSSFDWQTSIYTLGGSNWVQQNNTTIDDLYINGRVDYAIDGDTAVFGVGNRTWGTACVYLQEQCEYEDYTAPGTALVFRRDNAGQWNYETHLEQGDVFGVLRYFGSSVAASGDTIAVGAAPTGEATGSPGSVTIFRRSSTGGYSEEFVIEGAATPSRNTFGENIALHNNTLVVSVYPQSTFEGPPELYVYIRDSANSWSLQAVLQSQGLAHDEGLTFDENEGRAFVSIREDTALMQVDKKVIMYRRDSTNRWSVVAIYESDALRVEHNRLWLSDGAGIDGNLHYTPLGFTPGSVDFAPAEQINSATTTSIVEADSPVNDVQSDAGELVSTNPTNNTDGNCTYDDAIKNDGWGWDPVNFEACPPRCIDTDGDGWGWDGVKSCVVTSRSPCIDTDGDGWGWNGVESCRP